MSDPTYPERVAANLAEVLLTAPMCEKHDHIIGDFVTNCRECLTEYIARVLKLYAEEFAVYCDEQDEPLMSGHVRKRWGGKS